MRGCCFRICCSVELIIELADTVRIEESVHISKGEGSHESQGAQRLLSPYDFSIYNKIQDECTHIATMLPQIVLSSLSSVGSIFPDSWLNYRLQHACPPLPKGDLIYDVYMGYPEIFQWDKKRCVAYVRYVKRTPLPSRYNALPSRQ